MYIYIYIFNIYIYIIYIYIYNTSTNITLLLEQHYPEGIIKAGITKALQIPQNELRNVKEQ